MHAQSLVKQRLAVEVSDPWELARDEGTPPLLGDVKDARAGKPGGGRVTLLLELQEPLEVKGVLYNRLVAQLDGALSTMDALAEGARVEADLYGIPMDKEVVDPVDPSWWRGGLGMIGSLVRTATAPPLRTRRRRAP